MSLDDVVDLSITVASLSVSKENFGTPCIVGYHTAWIDGLVREYAKPTDMLDDGFTASHYIYKAAEDFKAQNPTSKTFKIGRRTTPLTQVVHATPTITTEGHVYRWTVDGNAGTYTVGAAATIQVIVEAIQPLIDAYSGVSCTEDNAKIVVTSSAAGSPREMVFGKGFNISDETADTTTDDAIAAILAEDDAWYGCYVADSFSKATGLLSAATIEATRRMNFLQSADSAVYDSGSTTDLFYALDAAGYARTVPVYHRMIGASEHIAAAALAVLLANTPGAITLAHKRLASITVDTLTQAQQTAIIAKNANYYITLGAQGDLFDGRTSAGEYADITHFVDWLYSSMRLRTVATLQAAKKIPYTDSGADVVRGAVLAVLKQGVTQGGLADTPAPTCTIPLVASVDPAQRAARHLPDVEFDGQLAGAIHTVTIDGLISV